MIRRGSYHRWNICRIIMKSYCRDTLTFCVARCPNCGRDGALRNASTSGVCSQLLSRRDSTGYRTELELTIKLIESPSNGGYSRKSATGIVHFVWKSRLSSLKLCPARGGFFTSASPRDLIEMLRDCSRSCPRSSQGSRSTLKVLRTRSSLLGVPCAAYRIKL